MCAAIRKEKNCPQISCTLSRKVKQHITGDGWHLRNGKLAQITGMGKAVKYCRSSVNRKLSLQMKPGSFG